MNNLKNLGKKQARKVIMTFLVFILLIGALLTPFVALNEYLEHPLSITLDIFFGGNFTVSLNSNVNAKVVKYRDEITKWLSKDRNGYIDLQGYENVILAIMMAESGGEGNDPMQSSECGKNTKYPRKPGGITDSSYSIECGVKNFADGLFKATEGGLRGTNALYSAIDGYNKGLGIISEHIKNGNFAFETSCQYCYEHRSSNQKKSYSSAAILKQQYGLRVNSYWDGGNWRWSYGNMFYVYKVLSYMTITENITDNSSIGNRIAVEAQNNLGKYYWWGKSGPDYFDCSGLVYWCHKQSRVNISRATADGYSQMGMEVSYNDLKMGDIITFDWDKDGHGEHVGIYIGNGYMIHANGNSSIRGDSSKYVVERKNITSGYYRNHILNCRRLYE